MSLSYSFIAVVLNLTPTILYDSKWPPLKSVTPPWLTMTPPMTSLWTSYDPLYNNPFTSYDLIGPQWLPVTSIGPLLPPFSPFDPHMNPWPPISSKLPYLEMKCLQMYGIGWHPLLSSQEPCSWLEIHSLIKQMKKSFLLWTHSIMIFYLL